MQIGIFGGTFDPPHLGHLILASEACDQLRLDELLWVLTPIPPHKLSQKITPLDARLKLMHAAIADNPMFKLSTVDMDRPGPHYANDTVRLLQAQYPDDRLVYLIGGDSLHDLPTWHDPQAFIETCDEIGVMRRPGDTINLDELERQLPGLRQKVRFIDAPLLEISSSEIRHRIATCQHFRYYLPPLVYQLILRSGLYQDPEC